MFAPEGYVPLSILWRQVWKSYEKAAKERFLEISEDNKAYARRATPLDLLESTLFKTIREEARICDHLGHVVRFDLLKLQFGFFVVDDYLRDLRKHGEDQRLLLSREFCRAHLIYELSPRPATQIHKEHTELPFRRIPYFFERMGYIITGRSFDIRAEHAKNFGITETMFELHYPIRSYIRPFEGWALCLPNAYASNGLMKKVAAALKVATLDDVNPRGRPGKIDTLKPIYLELWPRGHEAAKLRKSVAHLMLNKEAESRGLKPISLSSFSTLCKQIESSSFTAGDIG